MELQILIRVNFIAQNSYLYLNTYKYYNIIIEYYLSNTIKKSIH